MSNLTTLKREIAALSHIDFSELAAWFSELRGACGDLEMERNAAAGKFDKLAEEARADIAAGRLTPLVHWS